MIKPDIICVQPPFIDYPAFRATMTSIKDKINKLIIVFTNQNVKGKMDLRWFISNALPFSTTVVYPEIEGDWRNNAINEGLEESDADWLWFIEQDFMFTTPFTDKLLAQDKFDCVAYKQGERWHPCCILIKRSILDQTSKDFSANPPVSDHFGKFIEEEIG